MVRPGFILPSEGCLCPSMYPCASSKVLQDQVLLFACRFIQSPSFTEQLRQLRKRETAGTQHWNIYTRKPIHLLQRHGLLILFDSTVEILHEKTNPSTAAKRLDDFFFDSTLESLQRKPFRSLWSNVGIFFENTSNDFYNLSIDTAPL